MGGAARLVIAVPALLTLGWAGLYAHSLGETGAASSDATKEMEMWVASGTRPGEEAMSSMRDKLEAAVGGDPKDPSIHHTLGRLALVGSREEQRTDEAIAQFTVSLQQRPTWPYSWVNLVEALYRRGDTGPLFEGTLQRAAATGPWEPDVQRVVADYGLAIWPEASVATRSAVERLVANGMTRNAGEMLQISQRRGRLTVACAHLGKSTRTDPKWTKLCQSTEAT